MVVGLLLSFLIGWLIGGIGNWFADQLPYLPQSPLHFDWDHYLRSLRFGRAETPASEGVGGARPFRNALLTVGMALAFAVGWWRFGSDVGQLIVAWFYTAWLLVVLVIDFEHRRVLNIMLP